MTIDERRTFTTLVCADLNLLLFFGRHLENVYVESQFHKCFAQLLWSGNRERRDAKKRCPGDANYDPRTLYLPPDFLKSLSGGQRQWWEFKSKHMDKVLFFKMGKFYEIFEMDARIGAIGLQYMKEVEKSVLLLHVPSQAWKDCNSTRFLSAKTLGSCIFPFDFASESGSMFEAKLLGCFVH
ncbi:hypothetical protein CerSpe_249090 [Prunus speciosa]